MKKYFWFLLVMLCPRTTAADITLNGNITTQGNITVTAPTPSGGGGGGNQLVGDSNDYSSTTGLNGNQPYWMWNGYTATASGSAVTGKAKVLLDATALNCKMIVMDASLNILATSNEKAFSGSEDGLETFTFASPATITNGQTYFIALVHDGANGKLSMYHSVANGVDRDTGTSYATPRTPLQNTASVSSVNPTIYVTD